jgi:hypothetical protein
LFCDGTMLPPAHDFAADAAVGVASSATAAATAGRAGRKNIAHLWSAARFADENSLRSVGRLLDASA